jgi:hypothetical protein
MASSAYMDVYLNTRRDLLVVKKGGPMPPVASLGKWRKSKKRVFKVRDEIRSALQRQGYCMRKLRFAYRSRLVGRICRDRSTCASLGNSIMTRTLVRLAKVERCFPHREQELGPA